MGSGPQPPAGLRPWIWTTGASRALGGALEDLGFKGSSWGPVHNPHKQKSQAAHTRYIDFHDENNERIKIDDTRVFL